MKNINFITNITQQNIKNILSLFRNKTNERMIIY